MPKPMFVWSGSAWVSVATEVESLATYATQSYADNQPGMKLVVPTSVAVGSGSGSVDTNGKVTFTTASSISLNGAFNSTFDNYKILVRITGHSTTNGNHNLRMRASGTDDSGSNYFAGGFFNYFNSATTNYFTQNAQTTLNIGSGITTATGMYYVIDCLTPFLTQKAGLSIQCSGENSTYSYGAQYDGIHNSTSSYDGFTIYASAGTLTGTIRVYGYKN